MSSGGAGSKQEELANYEKDYLERLEKEKNSENLQSFVFKMADEAKTHVTKDYIGFCTFCTMGVARDEMTFKNNLLFHPNCFEQQGQNFPAVNKDLATKQALAKIELVQLKNLKIRTTGSRSTTRARAKPRTKTKTKKKKIKRRKKPIRRKTRRKPAKRRKPTKRRKTKRITKRRKSKRATRRRPARRSSRRRTRKKVRRRTKRLSSRRRRR